MGGRGSDYSWPNPLAAQSTATAPMPTDFRAAHTTDADWQTAVDHCLEQLGELPAGANLGFLYVTDAFADSLEDILSRFVAATGIVAWTGSVGIGILGGNREYHERPAISVMIGVFAPDSFRILPTLGAEVDALPESQRAWIRQTGASFAVVHGDPGNDRMPQLVEELADALGGFLVGGITSSRGARRQIAGDVTHGGLSGVVFSPAVGVTTALTQGCRPFGKVHEITECRRNIAIRLDGRPALEVFNEEVGEALAGEPSRMAGYIFAALPIRGSDTGDYLVRNLLGVDAGNKMIAIGEHLTTGDGLQFCRRDRKSAREDLERMLHDLLARTGKRARGALYYSCLGRGPHVFGEDSAEVRMVQEALGDVPLVGFFCNGEISHRRLYGYTGVLTLFT